MFENKNQEVQTVNTLIKSYESILSQLRNKEKEYVLQKRKEEYERIRPPVDKWWELKSQKFTEEERRNRMILKATPQYFEKLNVLQDPDLY